MPEYYWELVRRDGTTVDIPPNAVETVQRRWDSKQPIHTTNGSIPYGDIQDFRKTSKLYGQRMLAEQAAQAFDEAIFTEDGSVQARWVKKEVSPHEYQKHYSAIPSYHRLADENEMVWVAFKLAVHDVDLARLQYCTQQEVNKLTS